ncbi:hypothetical protein [Flavobacterium lindanitolerans]|uniref:hypothetical protein n=1 Tax=Flavobacterium lindanitolerans TaxID=428988 RepID=UPI0023F22617|nr:hypothetical protein [Flavobacterium lindanitolerans]
MINRRDTRSARKWCSKNNLNIYRDCSGEFVFQTEFDLAYDMPLINALATKHPEDWKEYYSLYKSGATYETINLVGGKTHKNKNYKLKGEIARKIFDRSLK